MTTAVAWIAGQSFTHGDLIHTPDHRTATVNRTYVEGDDLLRVECTDGTSWIAALCRPATRDEAASGCGLPGEHQSPEQAGQ